MPIVITHLIFFTLGVACIGAAAAWWLRGVFMQRKAKKENHQESRFATDILVRLQELASRVAVDVDEHSSQIMQINDSLTTTDKRGSSIVIEMVAKLIQANQSMKQKLESTEGKLRQQAQEIQIRVAEARTDALTMLSNRRAFDNELVRRVAEFRRLGRSFSLIIADVDHFKKFNDTYGHQAGDEALRGVAKLLRRTMREMDLVARYGGEEFAMILPGTNLDDATRAALRACKSIADTRFRSDGKGDLQVTLSFGAARVQPNEQGTDLIMRADKALYAAKDAGRNCVFKHDGTAVIQAQSGKPAAAPKAAQPSAEISPSSKSGKNGEPKSELVDAEIEPPAEDADLAISNAVTELPTRTNFCQQIRNRTAEWKRGGATFSVILIEVNCAEQDAFPLHPQGSASATQAVARYLTSSIRDMDVLGNYSPGCLALLLPSAELTEAISVADRLQETFSLNNPKAQAGQPKVALSIGVAQIMEIDDFITLLKRAEEALDAANRRDGNQTFFHDGKRCAPVTAMLEMMNYLT
jgi:diguanylate cyclase